VSTTSTATSSLLDPGTRANPWPVYRRLREHEPVAWVDGLNGWFLTRYADCEAALHEPTLSLGGGLAAIFAALSPEVADSVRPLQRHISLGMGSMDPPEHTRVRSPMTHAFTARLIRNQREFIQAVTDDLIEANTARGRMDVVADLAYPLPAMVIANLLGTERSSERLFLECSDAMGDLFGSASPALSVVQRAQEKVLALSEHLEALMSRRGRTGGAGTSLIDVLLAPADRGDALSHEEIVANCVEVLFAGHLTITSMIGTCILTLLQQPATLARLRTDPTLIPAAIEEILRYDGAIQLVRRLALEDVQIGGQRIEAGQMVWICLGAANRDPDRYSDPDEFDLFRDNSRHLGFGVGVHYCLGAALARLEAQIVIETFLRRLPRMRLADAALSWYDLPAVRSLVSLPIFF
jgi:pimeloyl-[acyl-carrier protein] synthase